MKISSRIVAALAGALALPVLVVAAPFWAFTEIRGAAAAQKQTYGLLRRADDLLSALKDAETAERGYSLTGDEAFLKPYLAVRDGLRSDLDSLSRLTSVPTARRHLDAVAPLLDAKLAEMAHVIDLRRAHDVPDAVAAVSEGQGMRLMDAIRVEMKELTRIEESALAGHDGDLQAYLRRLLAMIVVASLLMLLLALAVAYLVYRESQHELRSVALLETQHLLQLREETTQKLAQINAALRFSEEKLAVTLMSIGDAVIATDSDGRVTLLNPVAERLTGWTQVEALDSPVDGIFHLINRETRQPSPIPLKEALAKGTIQRLEEHTILTARDGTECAVDDSCAPMRDRDGRVIGAVMVFRDVNKEYSAQQALRDSGAVLQTILNTVADGIITVHAGSGLLRTVNPAAERMFGWPPGELAGQPVTLAIPSLDRGQRDELVARHTRTADTDLTGSGREAVGRRKDGRAFPLEIAATEMSLGGERYFTGVLRDLTARKRADEVLLKAGALQNAIFNSANFSSIATDAKGVIQIFNVGAERMLGYAAADVVNKITPADISDPVEVIARAESLSAELSRSIAPGFEALVFKASRGIEDIYELTYIRKDGSRLPAIVSVTALRDERNEIIGYLLIGTDNSARRQAEEALQKAGTLQKAIFNSANFSSIATDDKGVIQIFNVGAERMLGYAAADVINKITPADISDPDEVIRRARTLSRELGTPISPGFEALVFKASRGIEDIYELTYVRKDGSRLPAIVSVTALRDARGAIIGFLLIGTDNTERKRVEEEQKALAQRLRDSQFYTRSLFESNVDALMTTDPAGVITDVNKQMETLTGCTRDELLGSRFGRHFTDTDMAEAAVSLVLGAKRISNYELTAVDRDGRHTEVSINATTFYDRDRRLQGVFAAARDITERKHLDQVLQEKNTELEGARQEAETASLAKSEFISSMSHELRSPLNAILGFAQLIESDSPPPTPGQKESAAQILQAGWHLLALIDEILDLAKVESGALHLSREPVSLPEVLLECRDMVAPLVQERGIRMTIPGASERHWVKADRTRLKQVLLNLLSNAIKYNGKEGEIEVTCREVSSGCVRVSIRDAGAGLHPEEIAQLFQAFNRLGQEGGGEEGTGIGLVVAKRLVQLMGGTIGVDSTVGTGSVFWFELSSAGEPRLPAERAALPAEEGARVPNGPQLHTLLYVEDNPANLRLMEQIIARRPDIRLLTATNGNSGVEAARVSRPDVILMDLNLPGISGFDALKILRSDPATAHIPVVALTANALPRDRARGLKAGFFTYMTKPIKVKELMKVLDGALAFAGDEAARNP